MQTSQLPETGFVRIRQLVGDPHAEVPTPALIPVNASTIWRWIKDGRFPLPVRLGGSNVTVWRAEDIRAWVDAQVSRAGQ